MATATDSQTSAPAPQRGRPVREIRVRDTLLNRIWAVLTETIAHPFTPSVLLLERPEKPERPETPDRFEVDVEPR